MPLIISPCLIVVTTIPYGWGPHLLVITNTNLAFLELFGRRLFIVILLRTPSLATFKLSALVFYIRIFGIYRWLYKSSIWLGVFICLSTIATEFSHIFRCNPISEQWPLSPTGGSCMIDITTFNIIQSTPAIVTGFITLVLPVHLVWKLHLPTFKRMAILGVFLLGGFDVIVSILRLWKVAKQGGQDAPWTNCTLFYWSLAEPTSGLLCCCLITYGPLVHAARLKLGLATAASSGPKPHPSNQQVGKPFDFADRAGNGELDSLPEAGGSLRREETVRWSLGKMHGDTIALVTCRSDKEIPVK